MFKLKFSALTLIVILAMGSINAQPGSGGQGDPCLKPNPPKSCAGSAPIETDLLLLFGAAFGIITLARLRNKSIHRTEQTE